MEIAATANSLSNETRIDWWRIIALVVLCAGILLVCQTTRSVNQKTESGMNMELPIFVDSFMGRDQEPSLAEVTMLPKDTQFLKKVYENLQGQNITCQIVLSGGEKRSIHRPEICLPGQGWTITDARPIAIKLTNGNQQNVTKLTLSREIQTGANERQKLTAEFLYWFVGKDKTTPDHFQRVLLTSWDRVMHNVNHRWAYVIVMAVVPPVPGRENEATRATIKMLEGFIGKVAPQIQKPDVISS